MIVHLCDGCQRMGYPHGAAYPQSWTMIEGVNLILCSDCLDAFQIWLKERLATQIRNAK